MTTRTLTLNKAGHQYLFRYRPGAEDDVVDAIMDLADDPAAPLDWLDAATLSFQVTCNAADHCRQTLRCPPAAAS